MYTYERLYRLCGENSNESDIAHYLLKNSSSIARLSVKKIKEDIIKKDNKTKSVPEEHFFRLLTKCQQSLFLSKYGI